MEVSPYQPVDRISKLPDNVIDKILMRLTIRDAAKTSVLAKEWRHKWRNLPQLLFDYKLWQASETNEELARFKFLHILYQVVFRHLAPITKFSLDIPKLKVRSEIDHLIDFLSKSNVQDLTLRTTEQEHYKLPSTVFKFLQLNHLSLYCCVINPPPSFKGFNRLIRLELGFVSIETGVLLNLISSCPLLEQLALTLLDQSDHLEIDAPMLKVFYLKCGEVSICFKNSPLLANVSIDYNDDYDIGDGLLNFVEFFNSVPGLQELDINGWFIEEGDEAEVQKETPTSFKNLKTLKLEIALDSYERLFATFFLIRSCSNLKELEIEVCPITFYGAEIDPMKAFLEEQAWSSDLFHRLHEVTMKQFEGTFGEMALVELLLKKSPALKRMIIFFGHCKFNDKKLVEILKELNKFWGASPNAELIFKSKI